jgi:hypothetical protein
MQYLREFVTTLIGFPEFALSKILRLIKTIVLKYKEGTSNCKDQSQSNQTLIFLHFPFFSVKLCHFT